MANLGYIGYIGLGAVGGRMAARLLSKEHSVTGYNRTRSKAQWLIDRGRTWADSPRAVARSADTVFVMVSDSAALEAVGPKVTHVGANGLAVSMKIAVNLSLAVQMLAFSEGVLLAEKSGIARSTAVDVLTNSVVASPMVQYRGPFVLGLPDEVWFSVTMMQKDMSLALDMGRELSVPLPTTAVTNEFLTAARGAGLSEKDFAALFHLLARLSGVSA